MRRAEKAEKAEKNRADRTLRKEAQLNPFETKDKGDLASAIGALLNKSFSPGGLVVLGGAVFASSLACNLLFWTNVTMQMPVLTGLERILMGDFGLLGPLGGGFLISGTTTFFQVLPIVGKQSGDSIAKQFIAGLFRPDLRKIQGGDPELAEANANIQSSHWRLLGQLWFACTVLEVVAGLIFIGPIMGQGVGSLIGLLSFIYSIAGCQLGTHLAIMGGNLRAPKEGRVLHSYLLRGAKNAAFISVRQK
jgi:hypothetical protein